MLTETHTVQPLFFVVFLLCSDCVRVLCWSNSQTTVGALFVPSLLCDRYEGSPLCDQKTFLSLLSHSEPVWARVLTQEQPKCHLSLMFGVPVSVTQQCGADLMLSFLLCVWCLLFFPSNRQRCQKWSKHIWKNSFFYFELHAETQTTSAYKTMNCTLTGGMCFSFRCFLLFLGFFFFCIHINKCMGGGAWTVCVLLR